MINVIGRVIWGRRLSYEDRHRVLQRRHAETEGVPPLSPEEIARREAAWAAYDPYWKALQQGAP